MTKRQKRDPYTRSQPLVAWGECRKAGDWARDARCSVDYETILRRVAYGWTPEEAVTTPALTRYAITAWGQTKSLQSWAEDERSQAVADTIASRLARGWTPEEAIATAPEVPLPKQLIFNGETKTVAQWAADPRCVPSANVLRSRIALGWPLRDALKLPVRQAIELSAFGETKSLSEWLGDARCVIERTTLEARLRMGWHPVLALSTSSDPNQIEAFGESKAVGEWAKDRRCCVSDERLRDRIADGWHPERAMIEAVQTSQRRRTTMLDAFGESKAVTEWAEDRRCVVMLGTLRKRLREGWPAEEALSKPARVGHVLTAWGETKPLAQWVRDPRANGDRHAMLHRLWRGWTAEEIVGGRG